MATQNRNKYLRKQRNKWYFVMRIPQKYQYAFDGAKEYKRTTGETELEKAKLVRETILLQLKFKFKELDTGEKAVLPEKAIQHLRELQNARRVRNNPDAPLHEVEGAEHMIDLEHEKIIDEASRLFIPRGTTQEEINKASVGSDGQQYEVEAIKNLDKTGKAMQFIDASLGRTFNSYTEDFYKYRLENGDDEKKARAYINAVEEVSKDISIKNLKFKIVKEWARNRILNKHYAVSSVKGETEKCNAYMHYLANDLDVDWAQIPSPFNIKLKDLPKRIDTGKDRKAWEMEEMKLIYQADTPQVKRKPELKDLMALGMIYGARIEEFCQLTVANVLSQDNIPCLYIDKSKTDSHHMFGQRYLPIVDSIKHIIDRMTEGKQPEDYLITTDSSPKQSRSALIGGSFSRHKEGLGFSRPKLKNNSGQKQTVKDFHSFRKTVNSNLTLLGVSTPERNTIFGWSESYQTKQMAETAYLESMKSYPLYKRKEHLELWAEKFSFSF